MQQILNMECVELALRAAVAFGCSIQMESRFDRKHYLYGDLPAGYQITQQVNPFALNGKISIPERAIKIQRIQLEQDSAKTIHLPSGGHTFDLNRCGVGLVEIVTGPEMGSASEAVQVARTIWQTLVDVGVCGGILAAGQMRFDANVSVTGPAAPPDAPPLGVRVEIKNVNTFKGLWRAVEEEAKRQVLVLEGGGRVCGETRSFDEDLGQSFVSRAKESRVDYRLIPDGDLPALVIPQELIERVKKLMPESRVAKAERYKAHYRLSDQQVQILLGHRELESLFQECCGDSDPLVAFNVVTNIYPNVLARRNIAVAESPVKVETIKRLTSLLSNRTIDSFTAQESIKVALEGPDRPFDEIVKACQTGAASAGQLEQLPKDMLVLLKSLCGGNPKKVYAVREGIDSAVDFFMGPLMKINGKRIPPSQLRPLVKQLILELKES